MSVYHTTREESNSQVELVPVCSERQNKGDSGATGRVFHKNEIQNILAFRHNGHVIKHVRFVFNCRSPLTENMFDTLIFPPHFQKQR